MSDSTISKEAAVVIERIFDAPIELIWKMWTDAEHFQSWYGPQGATVPVAEMDVQVGGKRLICMEMQTPNGEMKMWFAGEYRDVSLNERLVYTDSMADEHGNLLPPSAMGMPGDKPMITEVTVLLEEHDGRTKMVMTHAGVPADSGGAGGWKQAFAKMADHIETVRGNK